MLMRDDLPLRIAHRDAAAMRSQHHHAFHHRLPADKGFLTAFFKDGQHLQMHGQAQESSQSHQVHRLHYSWCVPRFDSVMMLAGRHRSKGARRCYPKGVMAIPNVKKYRITSPDGTQTASLMAVLP